MKLLNDEQHKYLLAIAKGLSNLETTNRINEKFGTSFTVRQIKTYKKNHNISSGLTGWFQPGRVPDNKGKRPSQEVLDKCKKSWFKKGRRPHNVLPVGTEVIRSDGYIQVKIAEPNKWKLKHKFIWEEAYGEIPKGYNLIFMNLNRLDVRLDNLMLVRHETCFRLTKLKVENRTTDIVNLVDDIVKLVEAVKKGRR